VYYGDEVGVTGGDDPMNRAPYPWADEGGQPDLQLLAAFKQLIKMRHDHPVLRRGSLQAPLFVDEHVWVLVRRLGETWAITATNNAATPRSVTLQLPREMTGTAGQPVLLQDALSGASVQVSEGRLNLELPAIGGRVLVGSADQRRAQAQGRPLGRKTAHQP
jgi:hypothetical protein